MKKFYNILIWTICGVILCHASACVGIATGALEGAIEKQERTNRVNTASKRLGFNQSELDDYVGKMTRAADCMDRVDDTPKYRPIELKSPEIKSYKHYNDNSYITNYERKLLATYIVSTEICYDLARYAYYSSPLVVEFKMLVDRAVTEMLFLYSRLDNGEITWGQFNQQGDKVKSEMEYRQNQWNNKMRSTSIQVANIVALQEEQAALRKHRQQIRNEFKRNRMELQALRNDVRTMQNRNRFLEMCSRYPGTYMNCPSGY
jgi:hypothetical protein